MKWNIFDADRALLAHVNLAIKIFCFSFAQVRERLRVALERVTTLEGQLAAASQEVRVLCMCVYMLMHWYGFADLINICPVSTCPLLSTHAGNARCLFPSLTCH